jgi:hypothetical protein
MHNPPASVLKPKLLTDFYPRWCAARALLLHHRDPYGAEVNREIQIAFYGKELDPSRPGERLDQQRFAYPLYFVFFIAPLAWLQFQTAKIIFFSLLAVCAVLNIFLWLRFLRLRLSLLARAILFIMVLTSIPVIQNLTLLQPLLLAACFIAGAAVAIVSRRLFLGGALLAMATVKPQIALLPLAWLSLWFCSEWKRRQLLFWGFAATLGALVLASEQLLPGWLVRYPGEMKAYADYTNARSFFGTLLPAPLGWLATILVLAVVVEFCWRARRQPADSSAFAVALSMVLALTVTIVPAVVQPFNHVLLIPAVLLAMRYWRDLRQKALTRSAVNIFCLCAFLPWLLAVVAIAKPLDRNRNWLLKMWSPPLAASMALPFAAFGVLILVRKLIAVPPIPPNAGSGLSRSTTLPPATRQP